MEQKSGRVPGYIVSAVHFAGVSGAELLSFRLRAVSRRICLSPGSIQVRLSLDTRSEKLNLIGTAAQTSGSLGKIHARKRTGVIGCRKIHHTPWAQSAKLL